MELSLPNPADQETFQTNLHLAWRLNGCLLLFLSTPPALPSTSPNTPNSILRSLCPSPLDSSATYGAGDQVLYWDGSLAQGCGLLVDQARAHDWVKCPGSALSLESTWNTEPVAIMQPGSRLTHTELLQCSGHFAPPNKAGMICPTFHSETLQSRQSWPKHTGWKAGLEVETTSEISPDSMEPPAGSTIRTGVSRGSGRGRLPPPLNRGRGCFHGYCQSNSVEGWIFQWATQMMVHLLLMLLTGGTSVIGTHCRDMAGG